MPNPPAAIIATEWTAEDHDSHAEISRDKGACGLVTRVVVGGPAIKSKQKPRRSGAVQAKTDCLHPT